MDLTLRHSAVRVSTAKLASTKRRRVFNASLAAVGIVSLAAASSFSFTQARAQPTTESDCAKNQKRIDELVKRRAIWEKTLADAKQELENTNALNRTATAEADTAFATYLNAQTQKSADAAALKDKYDRAKEKAEEARDRVNQATRRVNRVQRELDNVNKELNDLLNKPCPQPQTATPQLPSFPLIFPLPGAAGLISSRPSLSVGVEGGFASGNAGFAGTSFDVPVDGGFGGFYFDARTYVAPNVFVGGRIGAHFGNISGARENPDNRTDHTAKVGPLVFAEAQVGLNLAEAYLNLIRGTQVSVSAGGVFGSRELTLTNSTVAANSVVSSGSGGSISSVSGGGPRSESQTSIGFTSSLQIAVPITPTIDVTGGVRYIRFSGDEFFGGIRMDNTIWTGTVGLKFNFYREPSRTGGLDVM